MGALPALLRLVRLPSRGDRREIRHLGDRHVPPGLARRRRDQRVGLDVDDDRPGRRLAARASARADRKLVDGARPGPPGAEARGVGGEVDRQQVAVEPAAGRVAVAVAGAEPLRADALRERADRGEAVVLRPGRR